jgi:Zn-dependent alcohol dehydrogenase
MKAAVVTDFTQPLNIENVPRSEPSDGQVLVARDTWSTLPRRLPQQRSRS